MTICLKNHKELPVSPMCKGIYTEASSEMLMHAELPRPNIASKIKKQTEITASSMQQLEIDYSPQQALLMAGLLEQPYLLWIEH